MNLKYENEKNKLKYDIVEYIFILTVSCDMTVLPIIWNRFVTSLKKVFTHYLVHLSLREFVFRNSNGVVWQQINICSWSNISLNTNPFSIVQEHVTFYATVLDPICYL